MGGLFSLATTGTILIGPISTDSWPQDCHSSQWQAQEHSPGCSSKACYYSVEPVHESTRQLPNQPTGRKRGRPAGSRNKSTLARLELVLSQPANSQVSTSTQRQTRSQSTVLGAGRTTGDRASGRRAQPIIRRRRCQWELYSSDEDVLPSIVVRK